MCSDVISYNLPLNKTTLAYMKWFYFLQAKIFSISSKFSHSNVMLIFSSSIQNTPPPPHQKEKEKKKRNSFQHKNYLYQYFGLCHNWLNKEVHMNCVIQRSHWEHITWYYLQKDFLRVKKSTGRFPPNILKTGYTILKFPNRYPLLWIKRAANIYCI